MQVNNAQNFNNKVLFAEEDVDTRSTSASSEGGHREADACSTSACTEGYDSSSDEMGTCKAQQDVHSDCNALRSNNSRRPEGLEPPPGLQGNSRASLQESGIPNIRPPPGLPLLSSASQGDLGGVQLPPPAFMPQRPAASSGNRVAYTSAGFRRAASGILQDLKLHKNVGKAVCQVRAQRVPRSRQASEFADLLTMALEESRSPARRVFVAFIGGVTKAFDLEQCLAGLDLFFGDIYDDLRAEVPNLSKKVKSELLPTFQSVLPPDSFCRVKALAYASEQQ